MHWIQPLSELTLADIDRVGSKAAHLGAMLRAGFPVPAGFVIDISAFVHHFGEVTEPLVTPTVPQLQAELMADVAQALLDHLGDEHQVAVRSSSTEEDTSHASFAGQHSTYYFVPPHKIDRAITDCWMSLWSNAALAYRRAGWTEISSGEPVRMAVIVQKMVPATRSGVAFSRDPISSENTDCVIEASWGLGAALVDGRVTPDHIRVFENGHLAKYAISDKQFQVSTLPNNHDAQRLQEVPSSRRQQAVLSTEEAQHIANISAQLETLFEQPQDVEWAFVGDQLHILQSRPITTRPAIHDIEQKLVLFKPLAENFTEPLTPLSEDMYAQVLPRVGAFYQGRCYIDLDQLAKLSVFKLSEAELVDLALLRRAPQSPALAWRKVFPALLTFSLTMLADGANWIRTGRASDQALARYANLVTRIRQNVKDTPLKAMRRLFWGRHPFEPIGHQMIYTNVSAGRYFLYIGILSWLVKRFAPDYPIAELSRTYHGRQDMQSMALLNRLDYLGSLLNEALAEQNEASEQLNKVLAGEENTLPSHLSFTIEFEAFLNNFGHRGPREMELAAPSWRESPSSLLKMLRGMADHPVPANTNHGEHLAARDELHQHLTARQSRMVDRVIAKICKYIALRENSRHYHIMAFDAVRQKILDIEQRMLREAKLNLSGDIFFLKHEEILALDSGQLNPTSAHERVRTRRRNWQRQARMPVVETINVSLPSPLLANPEESTPSDSATLQGQCACPGWVEATARVIHSLSEADTLAPGEILVAPYTDPAWTPLFPRAGGIVVGTGSFLSHAGTVARELHVPCVVDVRDCMHKITSGQTIRLNATAGTVEILS